jgi:hypothetical protein
MSSFLKQFFAIKNVQAMKKKNADLIFYDMLINIWLLEGIVYITVNELIDISWYIRVGRFLYTTLICLLFNDFASEEFVLF